MTNVYQGFRKLCHCEHRHERIQCRNHTVKRKPGALFVTVCKINFHNMMKINSAQYLNDKIIFKPCIVKL